MNVIVTGASRGIGHEIALELASDFDTLYLVARSAGRLREVCAEITDLHPEVVAHACPADVTDEAAVTGLLKEVRSAGPHLSSLVNCAGCAVPAASVEELSVETWMRIYESNMLSTFLMTREALPLLKHTARATVVNVASTAGLSPRPGWSAYASTKAAVVSFSQTMAEELKPHGIRVHCVAPGRTATELRRVLAPEEDPSTIMAPSSVAKVVRFLVSEAGDVLKGQTIVVRGD